MAEGISIREFARREGLSDTLVRRAIKSGRLPLNADGKTLDPALVGSAWCDRNAKREQGANSANTGANTQAAGANTSPAVPPTAGAEIKEGETPEEAAERITAEASSVPALSVSLARKEHFLALTRELQYRELQKALIPLEQAEAVMFEAGRAFRDHWANFVGRFAPLIAADLDVEADRVTEVLTGYVHKHAADVGEPDPAAFVRTG